MAVNPQSLYGLQSGLGQILSLPTTREKAAATIPCLLDAFVNMNPMYPSAPTFAPWTWSTLDPDMAGAIEDGLKDCGVKPDLCKVSVCSDEERGALETVRAGVFKKMTDLSETIERDPVALGDSTKCHGCGMKNQCFFEPLKKCARCREVYYHSTECQRKHWKQHKSVCCTPGTAPSLDAVEYYNQKAPTDPKARALMSSLRLEGHPQRPSPCDASFSPARTPPRTCGYYSAHNTKKTLKQQYEDTCVECLLDPPPGSPSRVLNSSMDDSSIVRSLRPATEPEKERLKEVRDMQALIVQKVGPGKAPSSADRQAILQGLGPMWVTKLQTYTLALNTMDQGVPTGGFRN
ncbi:hypothetical protein QBC37DRAFT_387240 [Rhypophila decipiens]|uniref:MYND-type domain-containing protein n=1 Tax=Rhypophila decipiens TaxID=261697 RepID=A0AAN7B8V2_9PEZI|nr:hypothetical protein QBC37DRAFT_387240 [Rhypophila decipiens]